MSDGVIFFDETDQQTFNDIYVRKRDVGKKNVFSRNVISGKRQSFARHSPGELEVLTSSVHRTLVFLLRNEVGWKADS